MPEFDFSGLRDAVQASFKPEFAPVLRRARSRRRTQIVGATLGAALLAVVVGGGAALAGITGGTPPGDDAAGVVPGANPGTTPAFVRSPSPSRSPGAENRNISTGWMVAGDIDHLYARYDDCRTGKCVLGVVATADRGRTWRTWPLPVEPDSHLGLEAVGPRTLVARYQSGRTVPGVRQGWLSSKDGGRTWREVSPRAVDAAPPGWRALETEGHGLDGLEIFVADPVTGDLARLSKASDLKMSTLAVGPPPNAGMWATGFTATHVDQAGRYVPTGSAVEVSRDGGRTWQRSTFPGNLMAGEDTGPAVATADGRTVYVVGQVGGKLVIHISVDGGRQWTRASRSNIAVGTRFIRAAVAPGGRLLIQAGLHASESPLMLISDDRGRTVQTVAPVPGAAAVRVGTGYAQDEWPDAVGCWVSPDGLGWSYVAAPKRF